MPSVAEATCIAFASESKISFMYLRAAGFPRALVLDTTWQPRGCEHLAGITRDEHRAIRPGKMCRLLPAGHNCIGWSDMIPEYNNLRRCCVTPQRLEPHLQLGRESPNPPPAHADRAPAATAAERNRADKHPPNTITGLLHGTNDCGKNSYFILFEEGP